MKIVCKCVVWQYGLWSFQAGGTKLERFLHKNQHTQRKLLNFDVNNKKCAPKLVFFKEKNEKDLDDFLPRKLTLKVKLWHFLTAHG